MNTPILQNHYGLSSIDPNPLQEIVTTYVKEMSLRRNEIFDATINNLKRYWKALRRELGDNELLRQDFD